MLILFFLPEAEGPRYGGRGSPHDGVVTDGAFAHVLAEAHGVALVRQVSRFERHIKSGIILN